MKKIKEYRQSELIDVSELKLKTPDNEEVKEAILLGFASGYAKLGLDNGQIILVNQEIEI